MIWASDREHQHHIVNQRHSNFHRVPFYKLEGINFNFGGANWHTN